MENSQNIEKFSAYNRVCHKFLQICSDEKVEPIECLQAINRFFGISPVITGANPTSSNQPLAVGSKPSSVSLTKDEVKRIKDHARERKAKGLKVKASEVNLTTKEASEAKAEARKALSQGKSLDDYLGTKVPGTSPDVERPKKASELSKDSPLPQRESKKVPNPTRKVETEKTGLRDTAITKLKGCRRSCLQSRLSALNDPKVIHLVAYNNHCTRLANQWRDFQSHYKVDGLSDPLRGLPQIRNCPKLLGLLQEAVKILRESSETPGIYVLQAQNSESFWKADQPSEACPQELKAPLPSDALLEFEKLQNTNG